MTSQPFKHVFGPVPSRRLGRSLGVDSVPHKTCTYDCVYCQLGRTTCKTIERREYAPVADILGEVEAKLSAGSAPDYVTLSGSGEPTLHAGIAKVIAGVKRLTSIPVAVLTNGSLLGDPQVQEDVLDADLVLPSLDAGDPYFFEHVNHPHPDISFDAMVEGLVRFRERFAKPIWLEVFLLHGINTVDAQVEKIAQHAARIRPDRVQLNTVSRPPAEDLALAVPAEILARLTRKFKPAAEVIVGREKAGATPSGSVTADEILGLLRRRPCSPEDIARGLAAHPLEVLKLLDGLLQQNRVAVRAEAGQFYYLLSDACT